MRRSMFHAVSFLVVAFLATGIVARLTPPAHSEAPKQSDKKQTEPPARVRSEVKEETVDLLPDIKNKKFTDGRHLLRTLPSGLKISIFTRKNQVIDVLFTGKDGKEEKGVERSGSPQVARKKGAPTHKEPTPPPCTRIVCHGSTTKVIGPDGQIESETTTNTCVRVPCLFEGTANPFANDPVSVKSAHGSGAVGSTPPEKAAEKKKEPLPFKRP